MCIFLIKVSNIHVYVEKCIMFKKKDVYTIFNWRFNVTVTSQSDEPILAYLRLESGVLYIPAGINMNCLISCGNFTGDMLISEPRS